jgi:hypothetical protein
VAEVTSKGGNPTPAAGEGTLDTVARLGAQRRKFKDAAKRLTEERDTLKAERDKMAKELEEAKKAAGADKIAELEGRLREQAHRGKFNELAKAAGVKEKALNDLWEKSGYKAEGDAPDETKIKAAIEGQRSERDYLFEPAAQGQQGGETPFVVPGPGRGQGGTAQNIGNRLDVTQAQLRDPAWCFANQAHIAKIGKEVANMPTAKVTERFAIV